MSANPIELSLSEETQNDPIPTIIPEMGEGEPISKVLQVEIESPLAIYGTIIKLTTAKDTFTLLSGEKIGSVRPENPEHPILSVETSVTGLSTFTEWEPIPDRPGAYRGVGEIVDEFNVATTFELHNHTFIDAKRTEELVTGLQHEGYGCSAGLSRIGEHIIRVQKDGFEFELRLGYQNEEELLSQLEDRVAEAAQYGESSKKYAQQRLVCALEKNDPCEVTLQVKNDHPGMAPDGTRIKSVEHTLEHIKQAGVLCELTAELLVRALVTEKGKSYEPLEMVWRSKSVTPAVWYEKDSFSSAEQSLQRPITEINNSTIRAIQALNDEKVGGDFVGEKGLHEGAAKTLKLSETYFAEKYGNITPIVLEQMPEKERALLALSLAIKLAEDAIPHGNTFMPASRSEIAGLTFRVYGISNKDRLAFYLQQHRKFKYDTTNAEAADFFLLHTTFSEHGNGPTLYEQRQSQNLEAARIWVAEELEPLKLGMYDVEDARALNIILLKGLVPDRALGTLRKTKNAYIVGRIGMTDADDVEGYLGNLLSDAGALVSKATSERLGGGGQVSLEKWLPLVVRRWAYFDAIHPMEEGNGRTGTLIFESWLRVALGRKVNFKSERKEARDVIDAMSTALKAPDTVSQFYYINDHSNNLPDPNIDKLAEFVRAHLYEDGKLVE